MGVGELLDAIRDLYIARFVAAEEQMRRDGVLVASEAVLCDQSGAVIGEGVLGLPLRVDLVVSDADVNCRVSVDSDRILTFQPFEFAWPGGLRVSVRPFSWDSLIVRFGPTAGPPDWSPLVAWFREWFRDGEDGRGTPLGLVHFLSDPEAVEGRTRFEFDLGTAPVTAFEAMLDAAVAVGVSEVVVGEDDRG